MVITDVMQTNYWHLILEGSRKNVAEALKLFPSPVVTSKKGWFTKNIRAYHSGGAVLVNGIRAEDRCLECQFPSFSNVDGLKYYTPMFSAGFEFKRRFPFRPTAQSFMETLQQTTDNSDLVEVELTRQITDRYGRKYTADMPEGYEVRGVIASTDVKRMIDFYEELKNKGGNSLGDFRYSPYSKFRLEESRLL